MAGEEETDRLFKLVKSAYDGDLENVKRLVVKENVDKRCEISMHYANALGAALCADNIEIVKFLIGFGAGVNVKSDATPPLLLACDIGCVDVVTSLLDRGANIDDTDWDHRSALFRACDCDKSEVVNVLLQRGADVGVADGGQWTPLHICRSGRVARMLLENGADVNARDGEGYTPLARMSLSDDADRVATLLDYGGGSGIICRLQHNKLDENCSETVLMCCYASCHEEIFREWLPCYERYFIKSELAGIQNVLEKPVDPPELGVDWSQSERDAFKEQCSEELARMKTDTIHNTNATYFSLLTRNLSDLRGQRILHNIKWGICHQTYPIYANMIRCSYQRLRRFFLKDQSLEFFSLIPESLLSECAEMVLDFLPDQDLETICTLVRPMSVPSQ